MDYNFTEIEAKWQKKWKETNAYKVSNESSKLKYYVLDMFPYPSGAGLHVGHPLGYIASDIYSRYKRLKGFNVLHPMGFDSFGLPAEQYALETGQHPAVTTQKNIETFKAQLDKIGFCYDWSREVRTSDPSYYKWTQKIFLELFNSYFCNTCKQAKPIAELIKKYETKGGSSFTANEWNSYSQKEQAEILMKRRLAFSAFGEVNWCEALGTVLANDEVVNGVSERGGHPVVKKKMRQWYLRITAYADRLLEGLETVQFSEPMKEMQRNWIGRSEGAEIRFVIEGKTTDDSQGTTHTRHPTADNGQKTADNGQKTADNGQKTADNGQQTTDNGQQTTDNSQETTDNSQKRTDNSQEFTNNYKAAVVGGQLSVVVYTTRPDTIFGVDFLVLAPEHILVNEITTTEQKAAVEDYLTYVKSRSDRERMSEVKQITGCFTGAYAIHPFTGKPVPVWIAEYVLIGYGTGAIMAVPCGDQRDFAFAQHFNIPITNIIGNGFNGEEANPTKEATLHNSDFLDGMLMKDAISVAINKIEELGFGKRKVNYRMRDAGFSRQRYWGEPFPIVWQDDTAIALSETDLPLELPYAEKYGPGPEGEGPLANMEEWVNLTPNPSPKKRELQDLGEDKSEDLQTWGYMNSSFEEWRKTFEFAKQNRRNLTESEDAVWQLVRNRNIEDSKFRRQHPIAGFIPDFVCLEKRLIIEIDGGYHNAAEQMMYDEARENWLKEFGFDIIRFTNEEVLNNIAKVKEVISKKLGSIQTSASLKSSQAPLLWRGGGEVKRETSTMPGYAGSSWYFLRYMDPHNTETFCDRKASDYWNQVDVYVGGTEHAVGHLLYSRMWTKVLYDLGYIGFDEPFKKLVNQGMIQGSSRYVYTVNLYGVNITSPNELLISSNTLKELENSNSPKQFLFELLKTYFPNLLKSDNIESLEFIIGQNRINVDCVDGVELDFLKLVSWRKSDYQNSKLIKESNGKFICGSEVEKMSKSKYNTVNPDDLCNQYGADTFRMYEMFLGPVEQSKPWDTKGIEGVHRFLKKLWRLFYADFSPIPSPLERSGEVKGGEVKWTHEKPTDVEYKILHKTIKKIEQDTENFSYNTAVAAFMIAVNELTDAKCYKKEILSQILILLTPYAPHIAEELWSALGCEGSILDATYPILNETYLLEATKEYPVSINGRTRSSINLPTEATEEEAKAAVLSNDDILKWMEGKEVKKFIFVKGRMINVVV